MKNTEDRHPADLPGKFCQYFDSNAYLFTPISLVFFNNFGYLKPFLSTCPMARNVQTAISNAF
jgi:hypothetical protein